MITFLWTVNNVLNVIDGEYRITESFSIQWMCMFITMKKIHMKKIYFLRPQQYFVDRRY